MFFIRQSIKPLTFEKQNGFDNQGSLGPVIKTGEKEAEKEHTKMSTKGVQLEARKMKQEW